MQPLYDPQDILKILQSPEKPEPMSIFLSLKGFILLSLDYLRRTS